MGPGAKMIKHNRTRDVHRVRSFGWDGMFIGVLALSGGRTSTRRMLHIQTYIHLSLHARMLRSKMTEII
jgi:hypothetical protein